MQHLQEQLQAQYNRQQQQQNQQGHGGHPGQQLMFPGMGMNDAHQHQHQQFGQPNQNQQQWGVAAQQGMGGDQAGALNNNPAAMAMLQQQQQQQQHQGIPGMGPNNSAMFGNWQQGGGMSSGGTAMDASSASSAQLANFVGMGMGGQMGNNMNAPAGSNSNIQAFLQQQQAQQQQQQNPHSQHGMVPGQMGAQGMQGMGLNQQQQALMGQQQQGHGGMANASQGGNASAQMLLQQQLAKLQRQFQGQQPDNSQGGLDHSAAAAAAAGHRGPDASSNLMQGQHQLLQQMQQRQRGSATNLPQLQQQQPQGSAPNLQQQMQQRGNIQQQMGQQQRGSNANLMAQQQRGSSASLQPQMAQQQQRGGNVNQMGQRQSALARLQQMASPSSGQQQKQDGANNGMQRNMSNAAMHRNSSSANVHRASSQAQMHASGSNAQLQRDPSKTQMHQNTSHASMHRNSSSVGIQGQQQGGSNQNWMAPSAGNHNQSSRNLASMQNQTFQQQFGGDSNNSFGAGQAGNMSQQELLMQQLRQQQQQQQGMMQDGQNMGHGANPGMAQNLQMNFQNLQRQQQAGAVDASGGMQGAQIGHNGMSGLNVGGSQSSSKNQDANAAAAQKSFLDGNFAGGWQSNADLPDRRHIIFSILEVIKQMRPDTNKISQKLPHMAKSLEEHLYRSAQTKEEYLDLSTLKKRLQMIAHGLELHRSTSTGSSGLSNANDGGMSEQQSQLLQQMAGQNMPQHMHQASSQGSVGGGSQDGSQGVGASFQGNDPLSGAPPPGMSSGGGDSSSSKYQDPIAAQKKKVIRQQQQRLLLLRHASKCGAGPSCKTKFCAQMVTLWKHMKKCRDKNCSTSHCLSSRCVLNHYRICKSQGRTSSCEVCGPVMEQIKRQETSEEAGGVDPLTKDQEMPMLDNSVAMGGNDSTQQNAASAAGGDPQQLQQLQAAQMKLQNQLQVLKQLQRQQEQLLQQQRHLQEQQSHIKDPHTQQGQQLQQQQALLQQLQQRCQQQQVLLQQELTLQSNAINTAKQKQQLQQAGSQIVSSNDGNQVVNNNSNPAVAALTASMQPENSLSPIGSNMSDSKEANSDHQSKRGSTARRQSKSKNSRARGGKGKGLGQMEKEKDSLGAATKSNSSKAFSNAEKAATASKKRTSTKGEKVSSVSMPEPARKMIKLEPQKPETNVTGDTNQVLDVETDRQESKQEAGEEESKLREISVIIDDNEAKKKLVIDDFQDGDGDGAPLSSISRESIERHLDSLEKPSGMSLEDVKKSCLPLVQELIDDPFGWVFRDPVDPVALGLPDYFEVVKKPMHLELVKTKLENSDYPDMDSFQKDVSLVFENSILYNGESSEVGQLALNMLSNFAEKYEASVKEREQRNVEQRNACSLCGSSRYFLPTNLFCIGAQCNSPKIAPNATCYSDHTGQNNMCESCYTTLEESAIVVLDDGSTARKEDLKLRKNDAKEEPFIRCEVCQFTAHRTCTLADKKNVDAGSYKCPTCNIKLENYHFKASDLPQNELSMTLEKGLERALSVLYEKNGEESERVEGLSVRVVSSIDAKHSVPFEVNDLFSDGSVPNEFPVRSKCIALFQTIGGMDVHLLMLYVNEYGQECPLPNRGRVYICHLEANKFLQPACYRSDVYKSLLIEYLRYAKDRGFHTAHVWSCSATPNDQFTLHSTQVDSTTPAKRGLRSWFEHSLELAMEQGVILRKANLLAEVKTDSKLDPKLLPLFDGGAISLEIEDWNRHDATGIVSADTRVKAIEALQGTMGELGDNLIVAHLSNHEGATAVEGEGDVSELPQAKRAKVENDSADESALDGQRPSKPDVDCRDVQDNATADEKGFEVEKKSGNAEEGAIKKKEAMPAKSGEDGLAPVAGSIGDPSPKSDEEPKRDEPGAQLVENPLKMEVEPIKDAAADESEKKNEKLGITSPEQTDANADAKPVLQDNGSDNQKGKIAEIVTKEEQALVGEESDMLSEAKNEELKPTEDSPNDVKPKQEQVESSEKYPVIVKDAEKDTGAEAFVASKEELKEGSSEKGSTEDKNEASKTIERREEQSSGLAQKDENEPKEDTDDIALRQEEAKNEKRADEPTKIKVEPEACAGTDADKDGEAPSKHSKDEQPEGGRTYSADEKSEMKPKEKALENKQADGEKLPSEEFESAESPSQHPKELAKHDDKQIPAVEEQTGGKPEESDQNAIVDVEVKTPPEEAMSYANPQKEEALKSVKEGAEDSVEQGRWESTEAKNQPEDFKRDGCTNDCSKKELEEKKDVIKAEVEEFPVQGESGSSREESNVNSDSAEILARTATKRPLSSAVVVASDTDALIENRIFESRLHFLNFCQAIPLQFGELCHAQYSTNLLLGHLNKQAIPAVLGRSPTSATDNSLIHAVGCDKSVVCSKNECLQARELLEHLSGCCVKVKSDCEICSKALAMVNTHARLCTDGPSCMIPFCANLRKRDARYRRLKNFIDREKWKAEKDMYKVGET